MMLLRTTGVLQHRPRARGSWRRPARHFRRGAQTGRSEQIYFTIRAFLITWPRPVLLFEEVAKDELMRHDHRFQAGLHVQVDVATWARHHARDELGVPDQTVRTLRFTM